MFRLETKLRKPRSRSYVMAKVITKFNFKVALDTDATRTQVVHHNHRVEYFPCENEVPKLSSNYEKRSNDDTTENFYNKIAKNWLSQLSQSTDSIVERQHLNDLLPIFPNTCGASWIDTNIKSPVKDKRCHSTVNHLASSTDSGIPQSSFQNPFSFQPESPVITSQPTTPSPLLCTSSTNANNF